MSKEKQPRTLQELQYDINQWLDATFGEGNLRFHPVMSHLREEVEELDESDGDLEEFADCLIILFDAAMTAGFNIRTLVAAIEWKLRINKKRRWGAPDETGKVNHIRNDHK